jgi:hypothetical protein
VRPCCWWVGLIFHHPFFASPHKLSNEIYKKAKEFIDNEILRKDLVVEYTKILQTIIVPDSLEKISNYVIE